MIFQKYNVNVKPLKDLQYSFMLGNCCLEHRINVLKDIGVSNLDVSLITRVPHLLRKQLSTFKEITKIPAEQSITRNIFSRLGNEIPNKLSELESKDKLTAKQYYQACLLHCKTEVFELPYLDDRILLRSYKLWKSVSMIAETLKILRTDLGYDEKMIKKHAFVITASADNIRLLLNSFDDICGVPIVTFLKNYPYLLFQDANNIKQLSRVEEVLADLKQQYSNSTEHSFTNNQYLALCLYMLGKGQSFHGRWHLERQNIMRSNNLWIL
ncbi:hypothetical protein DMN91_000134 [Ooceraea biroi]|uniref:Uncharacterized protein n=1 Tax=Ooceraea biroi TaxID=2015173 RepID=A0A3L8E0U5_OOCBI|nr:hypothetical protein DMN91_000134 [Ooceraea biroi]